MSKPLRNKLRFFSLVSLALSACASAPTQYPLNPLASQILFAREGHPGLVHQRKVYDPKGGFTWEYQNYDLHDDKVRAELNSLHFVCNLNGQMYLIAEHSASLVRSEFKDDCFWPWCAKRVEHVLDQIPIEDARIRNAGAFCFSLDQYPFDSPGKLGGGNE